MNAGSFLVLFFSKISEEMVGEEMIGVTEAATRGVLWKKVFLEILQNSQQNNFARFSFLIKLQACNFIKEETLAQVFSCESVNFAKFSRIPIL